MEATWRERLAAVASEAGLTLDLPPYDASSRGGRRGVHSGEFTALLDEMCEVFREDPDARW